MEKHELYLKAPMNSWWFFFINDDNLWCNINGNKKQVEPEHEIINFRLTDIEKEIVCAVAIRSWQKIIEKLDNQEELNKAKIELDKWIDHENLLSMPDW